MAQSNLSNTEDRKQVLDRLPHPIDCCVCFSNLQVMFLGVVAAPILEHGFDGKIFVDRVSSWEPYQKTTCNQRFTDDAQLNGLLRGGDWLKILCDGTRDIFSGWRLACDI